ncbi:Complex 1 LYR protein domain [Dillenia turbinata]|uniref:Complex 1 LYR protein domain n=1 Tax=Dillenia turbinata TaxID=194707 RepID=A0AAN8VWF1_9MAGN
MADLDTGYVSFKDLVQSSLKANVGFSFFHRRAHTGRPRSVETLRPATPPEMLIQKANSLVIAFRRSHSILHRRLLHEGPDTVEELLDRHLVKNEKKKSYGHEEDELLTRRRLTSTRLEALSLYRDIIRATRFFMWTDARGNLWRDVLRANARREFEEARFEKDPEVVTRLLIGGREAVQSALDKLVEKQKERIAKEQRGDGDRR